MVSFGFTCQLTATFVHCWKSLAGRVCAVARFATSTSANTLMSPSEDSSHRSLPACGLIALPYRPLFIALSHGLVSRGPLRLCQSLAKLCPCLRQGDSGSLDQN